MGLGPPQVKDPSKTAFNIFLEHNFNEYYSSSSTFFAKKSCFIRRILHLITYTILVMICMTESTASSNVPATFLAVVKLLVAFFFFFFTAMMVCASVHTI